MPAALNLPPRQCALSDCKKDFQPKHSRALYCSKECLWRSKNRRRWEQFPEREREKLRARWARNIEENRAKQNARKAANREAMLPIYQERYQKARLKRPWESLLASAKGRAKEKNLPYDLTLEWAISVWTGKCSLTDIEFILGQRGTGPKRLSPSIDRIDPALGYVQSNCRFIIHAINALKGDGTDEEMIILAKALLKKHLK